MSLRQTVLDHMPGRHAQPAAAARLRDSASGGEERVLRSTRSRSAGTVVVGLLRLSKLPVYQHYFGLVLAWLMLSTAALDRPGASAAMCLFLVGSICIVACACSADDLVGFRNGSDAVNYLAGEQGRDVRRKPLLSGAITEREAVIVVTCAGLLAIAAGVAAFWVLDWRAPMESYAMYLFGFLFSVQYSAGLRLSYHRGGAEALLWLATASGLLAPYLAVQQQWSVPASIVALLLGVWLVIVSSYSNVNDVRGDRKVGRRTLAATSSPRTVRALLGFYVLVSIGLICLLALGTEWPWWTLLTMVPATALHVSQLYVGPVLGRWLKARRLGLVAYDLGFLGIAVPTLFLSLI